ncbi:hypothetical protein WJX74_007664 [Apatococcus lobatus]|uniref:Right handed beta helix domain-containing protein n=1 Tax=Apatococcus lobatus TaxID=904363 RepID=A0AAW1QZ97_9CHLO
MSFTEALLPHAAQINSKLTREAQERQGRRLQQLRLPDGSLCCPTKPIPTALPPVPANDAPLTYPQYMNARCQFKIAGNGQPGVVLSASINCETDGTDVLMYMGPALLSFNASFKGVYPVAAQPNTINIDPGGLEIYSSTFDNLAVGKDFPLITLTVGAVYITDRATSIFRNIAITGAQGHFGGGLMVTDGASFKAYNSIFASNAVTVYGSLGGAIWLSACQAFSPAYSQITGFGEIHNSFIASNYVYGSGGGFMVSDCPNTIVDSSIFYNNVAYLVGGAISIQGSSPKQQVTNSFFIGNVAQNFFGGAVSQEPCDPTFVAKNNVVAMGKEARLPDGSLCCPTKPVPTALPPVPANDAPLTYPKHVNARCQFRVAGNGKPGGIISASINCSTADGTDVLMYMGASMLSFNASFQGGVEIHNSAFDNVAVGKDFPLITLTVGTTPVLVTDSTSTNINTCVGDVTGSTMCLPAIAATHFTTYVQIQNTRFTNNSNLCHSGSVYITNRATSLFRNASMLASQGQDCRMERLWNSSKAGAAFDGNYVNGSGGGLTVSDCPNTKVNASIFYNNIGSLVGGAIAIQGKSPNQQVTNSFFLGNTAQQFFGGAVSLEPCDSTFVARNNVFQNNKEGKNGTTGCSAIRTFAPSFSMK